MKFTYFIPAFAIVLNSISCSPKSKKDPQPTENQNITSIKKGNRIFHEITNDALGNPTIITEELPDYGSGYQTILKIGYEKNLAKTISLETKGYSGMVEYTINYINANEVTIEHKSSLPSPKWLSKATLKFNGHGLVETIMTEMDVFTRTYNYRYNENDNLIYAESLNSSLPIIYENYDDKPNPFYAKAKLWAIISTIEYLNFGTALEFPICKNNPLKSHYQDNSFAEKLIYSYDKNSYPVKISEYYSPKGISAKDSDYELDDDVLKLTYEK